MSYNRQYSMFPSKPIHSTMPMVIGRVQYEEPVVVVPKIVVDDKPTSSYPEVIRKPGVVTVVKQVMNLRDITHNDKAGIRFIEVKHSGSKVRNPKYVVEYHYNNPTDISHNDKASIRFIKATH